MNRCTWTEKITFEKFIHEPHYDEIKNEQRQRQCENMTDEQFDEYCRAYCKEHRIKVDEINKSRHKNCINKEKLIKEIIPTCTSVEEKMNWNEFNSIFQNENDCLKYIAKLKVMKCIRCASSSLNVSDLIRIRCLKCHQTSYYSSWHHFSQVTNTFDILVLSHL